MYWYWIWGVSIVNKLYCLYFGKFVFETLKLILFCYVFNIEWTLIIFYQLSLWFDLLYVNNKGVSIDRDYIKFNFELSSSTIW